MTETATAIEALLASVVGQVAEEVVNRPKAFKLNNPEANVAKILLFGHSGAGKTEFLMGPLLCGERLAVFTTDFGGNGLHTITSSLKRVGRPELTQNVYGVDLETYEQVNEFLAEPKLYLPDLDEFDPTCFVWEGLSNFQLHHVDSYILDSDPMPRKKEERISELRKKGLWAEQQDWDGIRRAFLRKFNQFFHRHGVNRKWHKIVSALEGEKSKQDRVSQESRRGVMLYGKAESLIKPAFDLIIECSVETDLVDPAIARYLYRCQSNSDLLAKNRGFNIQPMAEADPVAVWKELRGLP